MNLDDLSQKNPSQLRALMRDLARRAAEAEAKVTEAQTKAAEAEAKATKAESRATEAESRAQVAEEQARAETAKIQELSDRLEASEKTAAALLHRVTSLTQRLARARGRSEQLSLNLELNAVQRRLDEQNRELYGSRSERRDRPENAEPKRKKARKPQTGHGPTPQPALPRVEQQHLLDPADTICPSCEPPRTMVPWVDRTDDSEEITIVERTYKVTVHRRQVYRCTGCGHLDTALGPKRLVPGGRYSPEFAVSVAVDKYRDALPLARQVTRMAERGLTVTTQTLWDQLTELYPLLVHNYLALQERALKSDLVHVDETPWRVMKPGVSKRWWVWALSDGIRAFFHFAPTRGRAAARELLGDYDGVVMADRYVVYESLEKARTKNGGHQIVLFVEEQPVAVPTPDYLLLACWMHARRGFIKAARAHEPGAEAALDLIAELYAIEARAAASVATVRDPNARRAALLDARRAARAQHSAPVLKRLRAWADAQHPVPSTALDDALRWMNNGWTQLSRFLDDPARPIDNGLAERLIRSLVLGRKVYAGARSEEGTRVAALFYSLIASCRLVGVDAQDYLNEAVKRALEDREEVFLPEDFAALRGVTTDAAGT